MGVCHVLFDLHGSTRKPRSASGAEDILSQRLSVSEGATSAEAVCALAARAQVDMPICAAVDDILAGRHDVDTAIQNLMARPLAHE